MGANQGFAGELIDGSRNPLGQAAAVYKEQRGAMSLDQFEKLGMNGAPDRTALRRLGRRILKRELAESALEEAT